VTATREEWISVIASGETAENIILLALATRAIFLVNVKQGVKVFPVLVMDAVLVTPLMNIR
jgi:hypothetical protein